MKAIKLMGLFLACAGIAWSAPKATERGTATAAQNRPALDKGMTAEQIQQAIGKPQEIRPMQSPEGKAEVWTYRRVISRTVDQVATNTMQMPAFGGGMMSEALQPTTALRFSMTYRTRYQVTALLMFNGALVSARQWQEQTTSYE